MVGQIQDDHADIPFDKFEWPSDALVRAADATARRLATFGFLEDGTEASSLFFYPD